VQPSLSSPECIVDAHAHLDDRSLAQFVEQMRISSPSVIVISNSVDLNSSVRNIELSKSTQSVIPFVGIHPEIFRSPNEMTREERESMVEKISDLSALSSGIGEIGIDPKYGHIEYQESVFVSMLAVAEKSGVPVAIHSRDSVGRIFDILTTFNLKGSILFHWFAGTEDELQKLADRGIFVSYGPSIMYSKRMASLAEKSNADLILSETDSPTPFSFVARISTPYLIATVVFKLALIKDVSFQEMRKILFANTVRYLGTQTSLRVRGK
jgi:TatD DNase family protein